MVEVLLAGVLGMVISILSGPKFIDFLRKNEFGQQIREEGPKGHVVKQGTPAMGGLLIMIAMAVPFLIFSERTVPAVTAFFVTLGCAAIGFVDDWTKVSRRRSLGLSGRWKLIWLGAITVVVGVVAARGLDTPLTTDVYLPLLDVDLPLSWGWYVLLFIIIAGASNGVNLTDGIDGLAAGTTTIAILTYTAMSLVAALASIRAVGAADQVDLDLAILGASLVGASIGFLWYNAFPAEVFMGDTGSMGLGGALAAFAIMTKTEILLILIGGIFLIEALSVIVQVISFKRFGRRVLLMAPLHHHFEMKAWSETKITVRFWIVTAILCACGFVLYYRYASEFAS
ncbi:MAG TPA: phospho-N-acetylmuramoyl-pentapeptide-transferase [Gaiellaceae bacterium]|jgi:phospho-N-acetylmuramoyl-pentapeptide-transferase|nr:phospho-N-acetylmuramoyl-pentapeptide-transferase [Gaiellaceae bacterium]